MINGVFLHIRGLKFSYHSYELLTSPTKFYLNQNRAMKNSSEKKSKSQTPKCKVFEIPLKSFAALGVTPALATQSYPWNGRILMGCLALCISICSTGLFIIYEAKRFAQYTQSIYICSFAVVIFLAALIIVLQVKDLFEYIFGIDKLVDTSELKQ